MADSISIELSPQLWNWYAGFFISMGAVLSLAAAFVFAVITCHWLYCCARDIESQPTPLALLPAVLKLTVFQALVLGAFLIPLGMIVVYYLFSVLVWTLAPEPVAAPALDLGALSADEQISTMMSLSLNLLAWAGLTAAAIFLLLRYWGWNIAGNNESSPGFIQRFVCTYFYESTLAGFSLALITWLVIWYFLYNASLLLLVVFPAARHELPSIAIPNAERLFIKGQTLVGSWLLLVLFLPTAGLILRSLRLRWRYTLENPFLKAIFIRGLKLSLLGFCLWLGSFAMYLLADAFFKVILGVTF